MRIRVAVSLIALLVLVGCASDSGPSDAVYSYFEALTEADEARVVELSCADYEANATTRVATFASLDARLSDDAACTSGEVTGDSARVTCQDSIVITYGLEDQEVQLATYSAVQEGGTWRMCGEIE
ncbi:MAG: hypothetical protein AAF125_03825 [Chloroflexota bacterium]